MSEQPGRYNGKPIPTPLVRLTPERQRALLNWHPVFTGRCPVVTCRSLLSRMAGGIGIVRNVVGWNDGAGALAAGAILGCCAIAS